MATRPENLDGPPAGRDAVSQNSQRIESAPLLDSADSRAVLQSSDELTRMNTAETMRRFPDASINSDHIAFSANRSTTDYYNYHGADDGTRPPDRSGDGNRTRNPNESEAGDRASALQRDRSTLSDASASMADKAAAASRLYNSLPKDSDGRVRVTLDDGGRQRELSISEREVAPGVKVSAIFTNDERGRERPVLRWVDRNGQIEQQRDRSGRHVDFRSNFAAESMEGSAIAGLGRLQQERRESAAESNRRDSGVGQSNLRESSGAGESNRRDSGVTESNRRDSGGAGQPDRRDSGAADSRRTDTGSPDTRRNDGQAVESEAQRQRQRVREQSEGGTSQPPARERSDTGYNRRERVQESPPERERQIDRTDEPARRGREDWSSFYRSQTRGNNCLPTTLSMAYADWYKGRPANEGELRHLERVAGVGMTGPYTGSADDIARQAKSQIPGLEAQPYQSLGRQAVGRTLDQHLAAGHTAIVGIKSPYSGTGNHYIYVAGRDEQGRYIIGDPGRRGGGLLGPTIGREDLLNRMMAREGGSRMVAMWNNSRTPAAATDTTAAGRYLRRHR